MIQWISPQDNKSIVIASKVKILRNIKGIKFTCLLKEEEFNSVVEPVLKQLEDIKILDKCYVLRLKDDKEELVNYYKENFGLVKEFSNKDNIVLIMNKNGKFNILLNEEEHIGIECTKSGLSLREAYSQVDKLDDLIEEKINYSFDAELGYLTSNIKNLGTTLRAKVLIHLPVLSLKNNIREIKDDLKEDGISFKSIYNLGNKDVGNIYELSNIKTLGMAEEDILDSLISIANKLILKEKRERNKLLDNEYVELKDTIFRALGILKSAYIIDISEALKYLSYVRLGIECGIIEEVNLEAINSAMVEIQPIIINKSLDKKINIQTLKIERAKIIRNALNT
ncbi:protein arginine kinase [Clostridium sp. LIBA-8841]|uniref:protein arginine kinase n=1 Tax=Clostridium sp. LIBA-8841 TaxID=2987530 RepID=UPI002AC634D5|nr:protein arginine kinase [Clostridium sp. LIBA-8841]MDZ5254905.1 protein arginine kinase [Clostridium sp. LIBA-8841]